MTNALSPESFPFDVFSPNACVLRDQPRLQVGDPGQLLAALPALLGFRPHHSFVVVCLGGATASELVALARHDLVFTEDEPSLVMAGAVDTVTAFCAREHVVAAIVVFVDSDVDRHRHGHRELLQALSTELRAVGVDPISGYATAAIEVGARWWTLTGPACTGMVADPEASPVAFSQVLAGRRIHGSRAELADLIAVDEHRRAEVAAVLDELPEPDDNDHRRGRDLRTVLHYLTARSMDTEPDPYRAAEFGAALRDHRVRDCLFALSVGPSAAAAEQLWTRLARVLPDAERVEALSLLAYCGCLRGDGALAGVALDAALTVDPSHRLARLIDAGVRIGLRPDAFARLTETGYRRARQLGVVLPPPTGVFKPV